MSAQSDCSPLFPISWIMACTTKQGWHDPISVDLNPLMYLHIYYINIAYVGTYINIKSVAALIQWFPNFSG